MIIEIHHAYLCTHAGGGGHFSERAWATLYWLYGNCETFSFASKEAN